MTSEIRATIRPAIVLLALLTLVTGIAFPLAITGIAQVALPYQANGSLIRDGGTVRGSTLIGQGFARDDMFHGRPSAAGKGYDPTSSAGSNLAPGAPDLDKRITGDVAALRKQGVTGGVPVDLVTTSGSGLDPDISPAAALIQVPRVAKARGMDAGAVKALVEAQIRADTPFTPLGLFGAPHVNVLALNQRLDEAARRQSPAGAAKPAR